MSYRESIQCVNYIVPTIGYPLFIRISWDILHVSVLANKIIVVRTNYSISLPSLKTEVCFIKICDKSEAWTCNWIVCFRLMGLDWDTECSWVTAYWEIALPNFIQNWYLAKRNDLEILVMNCSPLVIIMIITVKYTLQFTREVL